MASEDDLAPATHADAQSQRTVSYIQTGALIGIGMLMAWSLLEIHSVTVTVAGLVANHVTQEQLSAVTQHVDERISAANREQQEALHLIQKQLTDIAINVGEINGKMAAVTAAADNRPAPHR